MWMDYKISFRVVGKDVLIDCILKPSLVLPIGQTVLRKAATLWVFLEEMRKCKFWPEFCRIKDT